MRLQCPRRRRIEPQPDQPETHGPRNHPHFHSRSVCRKPHPTDLVTASGSGLDPDITEAAARFQAARVAKARQLDPAIIMKIINETKRPLMGKLGGPPLVNVLELNLALDKISR